MANRLPVDVLHVQAMQVDGKFKNSAKRLDSQHHSSDLGRVPLSSESLGIPTCFRVLTPLCS